MRYMLDTNICIYIIKEQNEKLISKITSHNCNEFCISSIVYSELMYGVIHSQQKERNIIALMRFLEHIEIIDFDSKAAIEYGYIKNDLNALGQPIGPFDCLIAAHAKSLNYTLVTNNIKEFKRVNKLKVEDWA